MNTRRWIITIVACLAVFTALATYKVLQIQAAIEFGSSFPEPSETVSAETAVPIKYQPMVTVIGEVKTPQQLLLHNELPGKITAVNFNSGSLVKKNQLILELDISDEIAKLKAATANEVLAQQIFTRTSKLHKKGTVSQEVHDQAKAQLAVAKAEVQTLETTINKKRIKAPFTGITNIHEFEIGQYLPANSLITNIVGLNDYIWIDFNLSQTYGELEIGTVIHISQNLKFKDAPGNLTGTVIAKDSVLSANSRNLRYRAKVILNELTLKQNTIVKVIVPINKVEDLITIPSSAIQHDQFGQHIYVLEKDQQDNFRSYQRVIKSSVKQGDYSIIVSGLSTGEIVATEGAFKLRDGLLIYIKKENKNEAIIEDGVNYE